MNRKIEIPETFSGPMGLLHELVLRNEIDINDIPIGKLARDYLDAIKTMTFINVDEEVEFLNLASRLHEIKMRMLFPPEAGLEEEDDDENEDFDPRSGLVEALLEYRRFRDAARMLSELAEEQSRRFARVAPRMQFRFVEPQEEVDFSDLFVAFQGMVARMAEGPTTIPYYEQPISARRDQISMVLGHRDSIRFSFLLSDTPDKLEMVGLFIAMLELVRLGFLIARQSGDFTDIILERRRQPETHAKGKTARRPVTWCFPAQRATPPRGDERPPATRREPPVFPAAAPVRKTALRAARPARRHGVAAFTLAHAYGRLG